MAHVTESHGVDDEPPLDAVWHVVPVQLDEQPHTKPDAVAPQVPPLTQGFESHAVDPPPPPHAAVWQVVPVQLDVHAHTKPPDPVTPHVPPLMHGFDEHAVEVTTAEPHVTPSKPLEQVHRKSPSPATAHVPEF